MVIVMSEDISEKESKINWMFIIWIAVMLLLVLGSFGYYWYWLPAIIPPPPDSANTTLTTARTIQATGTFGDSFGFLTCIFSGLSSVGMVVAILMQRDELKLQRQDLGINTKVLKEQQKAQESNVKLTALSTLMTEYKSRIASKNLSVTEHHVCVNNISVITTEITKTLKDDFGIELLLPK